ncbi:MAG: Rrf2 family transcriptional regulator [Clostridia bacterium]|nr:Rrf2 family transcriptional regulator [Clostridia bacterium]MDE7208773.1 Rrf2 family transcriptional regulator [Clostridia bacterium]
MKLSSKARYGLKAMCYMADHHGEGVISLSTMSSSIGVSEKYLEQLISTLRKAGLISANRGANGGYFLSKAPDDISVGEIIRALEDGLVIIDCLSGECDSKCGCSTHPCDGDGKCNCKTYNVWNKLYEAINDCLDAMSLSSLIKNEV